MHRKKEKIRKRINAALLQLSQVPIKCMVFNKWVIEFEFYTEEFYTEENNSLRPNMMLWKLYVKKIINQDSVSSNKIVPFWLFSDSIIKH